MFIFQIGVPEGDSKVRCLVTSWNGLDGHVFFYWLVDGCFLLFEVNSSLQSYIYITVKRACKTILLLFLLTLFLNNGGRTRRIFFLASWTTIVALASHVLSNEKVRVSRVSCVPRVFDIRPPIRLTSLWVAWCVESTQQRGPQHPCEYWREFGGSSQKKDEWTS